MRRSPNRAVISLSVTVLLVAVACSGCGKAATRSSSENLTETSLPQATPETLTSVAEPSTPKFVQRYQTNSAPREVSLWETNSPPSLTAKPSSSNQGGSGGLISGSSIVAQQVMTRLAHIDFSN